MREYGGIVGCHSLSANHEGLVFEKLGELEEVVFV